MNIQAFNNCENTLHHATQFVSGIANAVLPKKDDDSQSALVFNIDEDLIYSQALNIKNIDRVAFSVLDFSLQFMYDGKIMYALSLHHIGKNRALERLSSMFRASGNEVEITLPAHYDIPPLQEFAHYGLYVKPDAYLLNLWIQYRSAFKQAIFSLDKSLKPNIWPHHFDSRVLISISDKKQLELGLAIADECSEQPYLYASYVGFTNEECQSIKHHFSTSWKERSIVLPISQLKTENLSQEMFDFYKEKVDLGRQL